MKEGSVQTKQNKNINGCKQDNKNSIRMVKRYNRRKKNNYECMDGYVVRVIHAVSISNTKLV